MSEKLTEGAVTAQLAWADESLSMGNVMVPASYFEQLSEEWRALTKERDALRAALELYAKHLASCEWPRACTCGLDQALAGQKEGDQ